MHLSCTISAFKASYLSKAADFNLPLLHLATPFGMTPFKFHQDVRCQ